MSIDHLNDWTIMVYMAGDNNLSADMVSSLDQLQKIASVGDRVRLFVYYDGFGIDVPTLYCEFSFENTGQEAAGSNVVFHQSSHIRNKLIRRHQEFNENSASVNNILNFVHWCVGRDTAGEIANRKYAFIFSGHTFGFVNKGLFRDEKSNYSMTYPRLRYMFERMTANADQLAETAADDEAAYAAEHDSKWTDEQRAERTTPILGKPLDLLGFDACVMSTIEIAYQFSKFSKTMVASEGSIPTAGWSYADILLRNMAGSAKTEPKRLAASFVEEFVKTQSRFALADISVDISAWDLAKVENLAGKVGKLADAFLACFGDAKTVAYQQLKRVLAFTHWQCQTYMLEQHVDLGDFCRLVSNELELVQFEISGADFGPLANVRTACSELIESLRECVILTGFSGGDFQYSTGASLFFPWSWSSYDAAREDYLRLKFIDETKAGQSWRAFLEVFLTQVTLRPPVELTEAKGGQTSVVFESFALTAGDEKDDSAATAEAPKETGNSDANNGKQWPNSAKQWPNSAKQWPNSAKQWPNSARQWPNSARGTDQISLFLSRFMKLKNNVSLWNRAGFTSSHVSLNSSGSSDPKQPMVGKPGPPVNIKSLTPTPIDLLPESDVVDS